MSEDTSLQDQLASMGLAPEEGEANLPTTPDTTQAFSLANSDSQDVKDLFIERKIYKLIRKIYRETTYPILLSGPTGSGKTRLCAQLAAEVNRPSERICLDDSIPLSEWLGSTSLKEVNGASVSHETAGILAEAIQKPQDVILDEKSRMSANKVSPINRLLDSGKVLVRGIGIIEKHPECRILATLNPHNGVYAGTHKQDPSTVNRYYAIEVPQFDEEELMQLVPDGKYKVQLVAFYVKTQRAIIQDSLDFEFSIRNIQAICEVLALGGTLQEALDIGVLNAIELTSDKEQRKLVLSLATAEFGTDILATASTE